MQRYARLDGNTVAEIILLEPGQRLADVFHPTLAATMRSAPDTVRPGWLWDGAGYTTPAPAPPPSMADLKVAAAGRRRTCIAAGCVVVVAGQAYAVWADVDSQSALIALIVAAQLNPSLTTQWKGRAGGFYTLDATQIVALATGVMTFVQAAFAVEAQLFAGISAGTITTVAAIDAAAWPTNG